MAAMIVLGIFLFKLRDLRDRWFQPVLITTPVLMITLFQQHLDRQRLKGLLIIAAASAAAVSILIPGKVLLAERMRRTEPLNRPYDQLAQELAASNTQISTIVTDTRLLGGNLRLQLPGKTCLPPELAPLFMQPDDSFVLAWDATQNARVPKTLAEFALSRGFNDVTNQTPQFFSATFKYHLHRRMRIGVIAPTR
jgi:hypothetical protein